MKLKEHGTQGTCKVDQISQNYRQRKKIITLPRNLINDLPL